MLTHDAFRCHRMNSDEVFKRRFPGFGKGVTHKDPRLNTNASIIRFRLESFSFHNSGNGMTKIAKCSAIPSIAPANPIAFRSRHRPFCRMSQDAETGMQRSKMQK